MRDKQVDIVDAFILIRVDDLILVGAGRGKVVRDPLLGIGNTTSKQVGFKINSSETSKTGDSEVFTLAAPWTVKEADALSINYDAVVSAVSQPVTGQEIMSVVFVLEWA